MLADHWERYGVDAGNDLDLPVSGVHLDANGKKLTPNMHMRGLIQIHVDNFAHQKRKDEQKNETRQKKARFLKK